MNIFNTKFVSKVNDVLSKKCSDGGSISSALLCQEVGVDVAYKNLFSTMVHQGLFPDYTSKQHLGIVRKDFQPKSQSRLTEDFVSALRVTLEQCVPNEGSTTRSALAKALGSPGSETEVLISQALASGLCPGFVAKRGLGVLRAKPEVSQVASEANSDTSVVVSSLEEIIVETQPGHTEVSATETVTPEPSPVETAVDSTCAALPTKKAKKRSKK